MALRWPKTSQNSVKFNGRKDCVSVMHFRGFEVVGIVNFRVIWESDATEKD